MTEVEGANHYVSAEVAEEDAYMEIDEEDEDDAEEAKATVLTSETLPFRKKKSLFCATFRHT